MACHSGAAKSPATSLTPSAEADRTDELLALAREAHWTFPTSSGRPIGAPLPGWAARMVRERSALVECAKRLVERGRRDQALELGARTFRAWILANDDAGGRAFLAIVLHGIDEQTPSLFHALALYGDALLSFRMGDLATSRSRSQSAMTLAQKLTDREAEGLACLAFSRVDLSEGRDSEAEEHAARARAALAQLGPHYQQAPLHMLAQATRALGRFDRAATLFAESLALNRTLRDEGMVQVELHNLGHVEVRLGRLDSAERHFAEAATGPADDPYDHAIHLFNRASLAFARGNFVSSRALLDQARALLRRAEVTLADDDEKEVADLERRLAERH